MGDAFPSLTVRAEELVPRGAFAEAQASYLHPDPAVVADLRRRCEQGSIGIVAHFYMDAELQGVLTAVGAPHTFVADSLQMADVAVKMAADGKRTIVVLGVDFMSENVRAVLDAAGHEQVAVYRLADREIGCSLAEAADAPAYLAWLREQASRPPVLHVVYINTSLATKARAHAVVPTITCTSSNVVQTLLQAASQLPTARIAYGPDTYMGGNLAAMLASIATLSDEAIGRLHPAHDRASVQALLDRFESYERGVCVVHHLFGDAVVAQVKRDWPTALLTAHLEVPGEMFALAAEAQRHGRGVVGSTSNILRFITDEVERAASRPGPQHLPVVLGTEAGMVTSIVTKVQAALLARRRADVEVEIVFPVASEAVAAAPDSPLGLVPGVAGGEGCSTAGGCATCPFMKMNSLEALGRVLDVVGTPAEARLAAFRPRVYTERIGGRTVADLGGEPILHMRAFQQTGRLPDALVADVLSRRPSPPSGRPAAVLER